MSIASSFFRFFSRSLQPESGPQYTGPEGPGPTLVNVTDDRAMQVAAVFRCIRLLSEVVASLPLQIYRKTDGGREIATEHPLYRVLHDVPNQYQTSVEFRETMQLHLVSRGNTYAKIERNGVGAVSALLPLYAGAMDAELTRSGQVLYKYSTEHGVETFQPDDILHIRGMGPGPIVGLSPLSYARQSLGLAVSVEDSTAKLFANGMRPGGVIHSEQILKPEQRAAFRESLSKAHQGSENAFRLMVLEAGFKYQAVTLSPEDAQMLQLWTFSIEEICRFFGVPPQLIGQTDKASSWASSLENLNLYFLQYTLRPYLTRWEQAINRKLLSPKDRETFYVEHNIDGLLRADFKTRAEGYAKALGGPGAQGYMTVNEVRRKENMPDIEGGDELIRAANPAKPGEDDGTQAPIPV